MENKSRLEKIKSMLFISLSMFFQGSSRLSITPVSKLYSGRDVVQEALYSHEEHRRMQNFQ